MIHEHILVIDTETSGQNENKNSILEASAALYTGRKFVKSCTFRQAPTRDVDLTALKYNGYRIKDLHEMTRTPPETHVGDYIDFLLDLPADTLLIGHNIDFDLRFFKSDLEAKGIYNFDKILSYEKLDTKVLAKALNQAGVWNCKTNLNEIAKQLNIKYEEKDLHTSLGDCSLTALVCFGTLDFLSKLKG